MNEESIASARFRRLAALLTTLLVILVLAASVAMVVEVTNINRAVQRQARAANAIAVQQRCLQIQNQAVILAGLRDLAHKFGVRIATLPGEVTQCPNGSDDVFVGTSGPDHIQGTPRGDFISGMNGADTMSGAEGNDTIIAGAGADVLSGRAGNDTLRATEEDHGRDVLYGGTGQDTCYLERGDRAIGCERIHRV